MHGLKDTAAMLYTDLPEGVQKNLPEIIDFDFSGMDSKAAYEACVLSLKCAKLEKKSNELAARYDETKDINYLRESNEIRKKIMQLREHGGSK